MNGNEFVTEILKKEIERILGNETTVTEIDVPDEWNVPSEHFPEQGKTDFVLDDGRTGKVRWNIEMEVGLDENEGKNSWSLIPSIDRCDLKLSDGKRVTEIHKNLWDAVGISERRYNEIENVLLLASMTCETKTEIVERVLSEVKTEAERRAFEVCLVAVSGEQLQMRFISNKFGGKAITVPGGDLGGLLEKLKDVPCDNPKCPIHGGKKRTTEAKHIPDDPNVR